MQFSADFAAQFELLLRWRRDVRQFRKDAVPASILHELIADACLAPSVGLSQPWRFVQVVDVGRRREIRTIFERCNAEALALQSEEKAALYARLKLAGLDDAPVHLAVFTDCEPSAGSGLGRVTMPETVQYSVVTAIHTFWLSARVRGIGVGWVSIIDPAAVKAALNVPENWLLTAYLCVGYPQSEEEQPLLQQVGWEKRRDTTTVFHTR